MKSMVAAVLMMCYGGQCERHNVQIEQRACSFGSVHAKVESAIPVDATFSVRCLGSASR
jgi:hypothetical protein